MSTGNKRLEVKDKRAANIQITAEQLINEALEIEEPEKKVNYHLIDEEELKEYRINTRKEYEDKIRKRRYMTSTYIKYALWEIKQKDLRRARSIFERALNVDYTQRNVWLKYIEVELMHKNINSARNLFERVVLLLPLENIFWKKYAYLEEILNKFVNARIIYERWIQWKIDETAFLCYIKFEERCKEIDKCREIFEKLIVQFPKLSCFYKFIRFERKHKNIARARAVFEKCIQLLPASMLDEYFYMNFCEFEEDNKEYERCKYIYEEALKRLPSGKSETLYKSFLTFQKKYASKQELDLTLLVRERIKMEELLKKNKQDYDIWFDYIKLEESNMNQMNSKRSIHRIRDLYERSISIIPLVDQKKYWKRYIYLWINYAIFEELYAEQIDRARHVYESILRILNTQSFTFKKLHVLFAYFELRQMNLEKARSIFENIIDKTKKEKLFEEYCEMELRLGNIEGCRKIYAKYVETFPFNPRAWIALINFELSLEELDRARQIAEIALTIDDMNFPELIWKCYLDMEINLEAYDNAEKLYERLMNITQHYKVYKSFAEFQYIYRDDIKKCREILESGIEFCKKSELANERAILINYLLEIEKDYGDEETIEKTIKRLPKKVKKRKIIRQKKKYDDENNPTEELVEEFITYVFPEDGPQSQNTKIFQKALEWKKRKEEEERKKKEEEKKKKKENSTDITAVDHTNINDIIE